MLGRGEIGEGRAGEEEDEQVGEVKEEVKEEVMIEVMVGSS